MRVTKKNYHQEKGHLSSSFIKRFMVCEESALYEREHGSEDKECFKEGRLFETLVSGTKREKRDFFEKNQDMISSQGKTKGELKSNYKIVQSAADEVMRHDFLKEIIKHSKKQRLFLGEIDGVPMKMMCDLLYKDGSIYDLKCMKDFKDGFSEQIGMYVPWFEVYKYPVQMYIYKTLAEQNGIDVKNVGLIAANKEKVPQVRAIKFSEDYLEMAKNETFLALERYKKIANGEAVPIRCENCDYCRKTMEISEFEEV